MKKISPSKEIIQEKSESIGNGPTSSRPVYLYRPYPRWAPYLLWRPSYDHSIGQHTSRVLQHTPGFSNTRFWRATLTGSLQPLLRTPIHCVHYWGKTGMGLDFTNFRTFTMFTIFQKMAVNPSGMRYMETGVLPLKPAEPGVFSCIINIDFERV